MRTFAVYADLRDLFGALATPTEIRSIVIPGAGPQLRIVGLSKATELLFLGDKVTTVDGERLGLFERVVQSDVFHGRRARCPTVPRTNRRSRSR